MNSALLLIAQEMAEAVMSVAVALAERQHMMEAFLLIRQFSEVFQNRSFWSAI